MTLKISFLIIALHLLFGGQILQAQIKLHTEDLPRFYQVFDSVHTTVDTIKQLDFIKKYYIDKGSKGLLEFMELRGGNDLEWRRFMIKEKQSLSQKRPWILAVMDQKKVIEKNLEKFKKLYPDFRDGDIYFCVGINNSGGTIYDRTVYIGTEVLASSQKNWALSIVLHEFAHTQQWTQRNISKLKDDPSDKYEKNHTQLLGKCIEEGMADFVSELVNGKSLAQLFPTGHTAFGMKNESEVWEAFKKEMFLPFDWDKGWLYNKREIKGEKVSDLGYFIGHQICKSYYNNSKNKKQALKEMLEMNITDENAKLFLLKSGYLSRKEVENIK
jgi:hypothetical protein